MMIPWWLPYAAVLAFFGGMMIRWHERMRGNRRVLLVLLERRGLSSVQDIEESAGDDLHTPTLQATLTWMTERTKEVTSVVPEGATEPLYKLTPYGRKISRLS